MVEFEQITRTLDELFPNEDQQFQQRAAAAAMQFDLESAGIQAIAIKHHEGMGNKSYQFRFV